ncbi:unnamed protein product [Ceutorhynchus assimilis]|uniref:Uncharacterized protein n=1 Tax=Ceutorhynchus assimilis TaxID=467358 RepID=A0A9N9N043_9CUCU|nr:unnamed protein product [Ceutorhynchus assimilis]
MESRGKKILRLLGEKQGSNFVKTDKAESDKIECLSSNIHNPFKESQKEKPSTSKTDNGYCQLFGLGDTTQKPSTSRSTSHDVLDGMESDELDSITSSDEYIPSNTEHSSDDTDFDSDTNTYHEQVKHKTNWEKIEAVKKNIFAEDVHSQNASQSELEPVVESSFARGSNTQNVAENCTNITVKTHVTAEGENTDVVNNNIEIHKSVKKKIFEMKPKISRKRKRNPEEWKRKKSAMCRERERNAVYSVDPNSVWRPGNLF